MRRGGGWWRLGRRFERVIFMGLLLAVVAVAVRLGLGSNFASTSSAAGSTLEDGVSLTPSAGEGQFEFEMVPDGDDLAVGEGMLGGLGELSELDGLGELDERSRVLEPVDAPSPGIAMATEEETQGQRQTVERAPKRKPKRLGILRLRADRAWDVEAVYTEASLVWGLE